MLAAVTARRMRASSRAISALKASGELPATMACCAASLPLHYRASPERLNSASFSFFTTASGVSLGRDQPEERHPVHVFETDLGEGRHVGQGRNTRLARHGERAQPPVQHERQRGRQIVVDDLDLPADDVGERRADAAVRDMHDVGAGRELELLAEQMADRTVARRRVGQLAGMRAGKRYEGRHVGRFDRRIDRHDVRHFRDVADRGEIVEHIERKVLVGRGIDRQRRCSADADRVAVRRRMCDRRRADRPAAPARFSTTTVWPSTWRSPSATMRPIASVDPPGANGTIMVMGLEG